MANTTIRERSFGQYVIAYTCWCFLRSHRSKPIPGRLDADVFVYYCAWLNIGHYLLMVVKEFPRHLIVVSTTISCSLKLCSLRSAVYEL